jgi:hypothetical protein
MNFEQKCTATFAELDDIQQKVASDYSLAQNPTVDMECHSFKQYYMKYFVKCTDENFRSIFFKI